jgi:hypothetical protein
MLFTHFTVIPECVIVFFLSKDHHECFQDLQHKSIVGWNHNSTAIVVEGVSVYLMA